MTYTQYQKPHDSSMELKNNSPGQPQKKHRFWGRFFLLSCGLLVASLLVYYAGQHDMIAVSTAKISVPSPPIIMVETEQVHIAPMIREIDAIGTLCSNESVVICSEIAGRIQKIEFTEGYPAEREQVLIRLDPSILKAELDQAATNLALHLANYKRFEALLKIHAKSESELDEAYAIWQLDEARLRLAKARLDKTTICAPFSGTLGLRKVSIGDYIQPGQPLVNLEDTSHLKVEFQIPEVYSGRIKEGQSLVVRTDAWPDMDFSGHVYAVNPLVDVKSRSLIIRGIIENREKKLRPGQFAKIALEIEHQSEALLVPEQAIIPQLERQFVYRVDHGRKAVLTEIRQGKRLHGWVEIINGLSAEDIVVTGGFQKLSDGASVNQIPADSSLFMPLDQIKS